MFQPSVPSPGVIPLMSRDNLPHQYRHCNPDHLRSPVSPILQTLTFSHPRSDHTGNRILPIPIHSNVPSSRCVPGFLQLFSSTSLLRQNSSAGTTPLAETLSWWCQLNVVLLNDVLPYDVPLYIQLYPLKLQLPPDKAWMCIHISESYLGYQTLY